VAGDEGSLALAPHEEVFGDHLVDRLAHRSLADAEAQRQYAFARNRRARRPFAFFEAMRDEPLDLPIKRAESRRGRAGRTVHATISAQFAAFVHR